jgi:YidC/Oxa1 family membrane protein insertase
MEKRLLLAAALSVTVLLAWELLMPKPKRPAQPPAPVAGAPAAAAAVPGDAGSAPAAPTAPAIPAMAAEAERDTVLETPLLKASFSNRGGILTSLVLKNYNDDEGKPLELVRRTPDPARRPFALEFPREEETRAAAAALFAVEETDHSLTNPFSDGVRAIEKKFSLTSGAAPRGGRRPSGPTSSRSRSSGRFRRPVSPAWRTTTSSPC